MGDANPGSDLTPAIGMRFDVAVEGVSIGSFTGVEGLQAEFEIYEYTEGGQNGFIHRLPGRIKYSNVKLTRALNKDSGALAEWFAKSQQQIERSTAAITALDPHGDVVARWDLMDVVAVKWQGPQFTADGNQMAKEILELAHNGFTMSGA